MLHIVGFIFGQLFTSSVRKWIIFFATVCLIDISSFNFKKNKVTLERVICKTFPGSKIAHVNCQIKYIDRTHVKVDSYVNSTEPFHCILHALMWYRYNTYQRIGGQIRENICDWLSGRKKFFVLNWIFSQISEHTNIMRHPCPLNGHIYFKVDNISIDTFAFPQILPAGRYRIDVTMLDSNEKILYNLWVYFSVSDHRVEVVWVWSTNCTYMTVT